MSFRPSCSPPGDITDALPGDPKGESPQENSEQRADVPDSPQSVDGGPGIRAIQAIIAIENSLVRLDVQDTLRTMKIHGIRTVSNAAQAIALLIETRCDAIILGMEGSHPDCHRLLGLLARLRIPAVTVGGGARFTELLAQLAFVEKLNVPFDSTSIAAALGRALQFGLMQPDGN